MLVNRTKPRLNVKITTGKGNDPSRLKSSGSSGSVFEVLRSLLEMSFKLVTMENSLSLGIESWRMKLINMERRAPKRPDYLEFGCRVRIERGRETYKDEDGTGHVVPHCFLRCIQLS